MLFVKNDTTKIKITESHIRFRLSLNGPGVSVMCAKIAPKLIVTPACKSSKKLAIKGGITIASDVFNPSANASPKMKFSIVFLSFKIYFIGMNESLYKNSTTFRQTQLNTRSF